MLQIFIEKRCGKKFKGFIRHFAIVTGRFKNKKKKFVNMTSHSL